MNLCSIALHAWSLSCHKDYRHFKRSLQQPEYTQSQILRDILRHNTHTQPGQQYQFSSIRSWDDWKQRVPISSYEDIQPAIQELCNNTQGNLCSETVTRLVPTGGSSGGEKLIPWTSKLGTSFQAGIRPWIVDLHRHFPDIRHGPAYWAISPSLPTRTDAQIPIGFADDSAYLGGWAQKIIRPTLAVPSDVRHIANTHQFRMETCRHLLSTPELRLMSLWHPSYILDLYDFILTHKNKLLTSVSSRHRQRLLHCDWEDPQQLWPSLRVISAWGDSAARPFFHTLTKRFPTSFCQAKGLLATEGIISIPFAGQCPLAITSHFFEFIDDQGTVHRAHELHTGHSYRILLTTAGGLYRYDLGDIILVTGFLGHTPSIQFIGRDKQTSDMVGEKLTEAHVLTTLQQVIPSKHFAALQAVLPTHDTPHYRLYSTAALPSTASIDILLQKNPHYKLARKLGQLGAIQHTLLTLNPHAIPRIIAEHEQRTIGCVKPQALYTHTHTSLSEVLKQPQINSVLH